MKVVPNGPFFNLGLTQFYTFTVIKDVDLIIPIKSTRIINTKVGYINNK